MPLLTDISLWKRMHVRCSRFVYVRKWAWYPPGGRRGRSEAKMRLVKSADVLKLTGLSADQLREWTTRRGLIRPDAEPHGPGSRAKYSWQTVLLLRLAVVLKEIFHIELHAQRGLFARLSQHLSKTSFPALRGSALVIQADGAFDLVPLGAMRVTGDVLIVELDPHLDVLSTGFGLADPIRQLPLFPAVAVR